MDKYEYRVKTEQMLEYMENKEYKKAMEIADTIDWRRVKSASMLSSVSEIYENNGEYQKSRDILFVAYDRAPSSRKIIYRLGLLALKINDTEEAADCYEEFVKVAPKDPNQYILKYKVLKAQKAPIKEQISALEDFKKAEYVEKWAYELASLYHEAGMTAECLEECDDLILWFSEGKYVYKAMELKMKYKQLTPLQQEKYDARPGAPKKVQAQSEKQSVQPKVQEEPVVTVEPVKEIQEDDDLEAEIFGVATAEPEGAEEVELEPEDIMEETIELPVVEEEEPEFKGSSITQVVKGATLGEALATGVALASGINIETKAMAEREEDLRLTGQLKIEDILQEWEEKQKVHADAIEEQRKIDEERLRKEREEAMKRQEAERLEVERKAAEAEAARKAAEAEAAEAARKAEEEAKQQALEGKTQRLPDDIMELVEQLESRVASSDNEEDDVLEEDDAIEEEIYGGAEDDFAEDDFTEIAEGYTEDDLVEEEVEPLAEEALAAAVLPEDVLEEEEELEEEDFDEEDFEEEDPEEVVEDAVEIEPEEEDYEEVEEELEEEEDFDDDFIGNFQGDFEEDDFEDDFIGDFEDDFDEDDFDEEDFEEDDFEEDLDEDDYEEDFAEEDYDEDEFDEEDFEEEYDEEDFDEEEFEEDDYDDDGEASDDDEDEFEEEDEFDLDDFFEDDLMAQAEESLEIEEPSEAEIQKRIKKSKGGVPFDTGFVVTGRYDLSATSEIGLKAGLTEEQKKLFSYFVPVRGMSEQIVEVLDNDRRAQREGTSKTGNLLVIGRKGSGKTVLAVDIVKAIQKQRNLKQGKVAIVTGESLNKKELSNIIQKLRGGAIIIEKAGKLNSRTVKELSYLMEKKTGEMLFVLEDQRKPLERVLTANPDFKRKFTSKLELPVFINDELVTFGQTYAKENGYKLDEMGILALYSRIDVMQREDHAVTVAEVKEIMDEAIEHSQKANVKHFARKMFGKSTDDSDRVILKEEDFKI